MSFRSLASLVAAFTLSGLPAVGVVCLTTCDTTEVAHHQTPADDVHGSHGMHHVPETGSPSLVTNDSCPCCSTAPVTLEATVIVRRSSSDPEPTRAVWTPTPLAAIAASLQRLPDRASGAAPPDPLTRPLITLRI